MRFQRVANRWFSVPYWDIYALGVDGPYGEHVGTLPMGEKAWVEQETEKLCQDYANRRGVEGAPIEIEEVW